MAISLNSTPNLNINEFAEYFQINPFFFNFIDPSCIGAIDPSCSDFWNQYQWTSVNGISIELLGSLIKQAETQVKEYYGLTIGDWITNERIQYPVTYMHGNLITPIIKDATFISKYDIDFFGQIKITEIDTLPIVYTGDLFFETAQVTVTIPEDVDVNNLRFYYPSSNYEIKSFNLIFHEDDIAIFEFSPVNLVKLDAIKKTRYVKGKTHNLCDDDIYLEEITVKEITKDVCLPDIKVYYDNYCLAGCEYDHIPACGIKIGNKTFKINLQEYEDDCLVIANCSAIHDCIAKPIKYIEINYYTKSPFNEIIKHAIWNIVASRLPVNHCECLLGIFKDLQVDTKLRSKEGSYSLTSFDLNNPIGSKRGEIVAYKMLESII